MLSLAEALWAFPGTEPGDLSFQAGDRLEVLEKVKDDWWKGRIAGREPTGLFPSSYVRETQILREKPGLPSLPPRAGYGPGGNPMTDVAHGTSVFESQQQEEATKKPLLGKNGEKFGKKLGNAAIFGAVSRVLRICVCVCEGGMADTNMCAGRDDRWENREYDLLREGTAGKGKGEWKVEGKEKERTVKGGKEGKEGKQSKRKEGVFCFISCAVIHTRFNPLLGDFH